MAKLVESVRSMDPIGPGSRSLSYGDGSIRLRVSPTPMVIEEAFRRSNAHEAVR